MKKPSPARRTPKSRKSGKPPTTAFLAMAVRALGEGVCVLERTVRKGEGVRIVFANESFRTMTGYTTGECLGSGHATLHVDQTERTRLARWLRTAHSSRSLTGEGYLLHKDGSTIYVAWTFSPMVSPRGRVEHIVVAYCDMTEKRGQQETLGHTQRLEAIGRLAGGVAHDFNNLISVINGYCEMLEAQVATLPQALHEVTEIHNAGRKAAALTRQLLAFGRRQPMDARVVNLNQIVRDNAEILTRLIGTAGTLELELDPALGNVRADPTQFQQVLLNLTLNARDALRDKGCIRISTTMREIKARTSRRRTDPPAGRYVVLTVADNGTGMDTETQKHLFEPFFTTKPEGKGSGLGLALVYGVVQQSGGFVTAHSELLVGSTFEIMLPELLEAVEIPPPTVAEPALPAPVARGHEVVLLLEEDTVLGKMVAGMLTTEGYRVIETASQPGVALARALEQPKPVQLLIANLTGAGEKLARALYKRQPGLRVLNVCNQGARLAVRWLPENQQAALPKPFALSQLLVAARRLLDA